MKIKFYLSVSTLLIILLVCNGNIFMVNNNLSYNLLLANIDALAFIEGRVGNVKVSECRTCSCNFGSGGSCEECQECVYYSGPFAGQSSGSITSIYCY